MEHIEIPQDDALTDEQQAHVRHIMKHIATPKDSIEYSQIERQIRKEALQAVRFIPNGMACLGQRYLSGKHLKQNINEAYHWLLLAAKAGDIYSMWQVAFSHSPCAARYSKQASKELNVEKCIYWYTEAAKRNVGSAMLNLACLYDGYLKEYGKAYLWYERAIECYPRPAGPNSWGPHTGMSQLLVLNKGGLFTDQQRRRGFELGVAAADGGDIPSMENIGFYYERGYATAPNLQLAVKYYLKALHKNSKLSRVNLGILIGRGELVLQSYDNLQEYWSAVRTKRARINPPRPSFSNYSQLSSSSFSNSSSHSSSSSSPSSIPSSSSPSFSPPCTSSSSSSPSDSSTFGYYTDEGALHYRILDEDMSYPTFWYEWFRSATTSATNKMIIYDDDVANQEHCAKSGDVAAMTFMGVVLLYGFLNVQQDVPRALNFLHKACSNDRFAKTLTARIIPIMEVLCLEWFLSQDAAKITIGYLFDLHATLDDGDIWQI